MDGHLVLARNIGETIKVDGPCEITIANIKGKTAKVLIVADVNTKILRGELQEEEEKAV